MHKLFASKYLCFNTGLGTMIGTVIEIYTGYHSVMSDSLQPHGLYNPWNSLGQNSGVGSPSLLQGIFPTQGLNSGLPHCRQILYQLSHKGSPRILEWVACPFSSGSSRPRNQTMASYIAGGFFTNWTGSNILQLKHRMPITYQWLKLGYSLVSQTYTSNRKDTLI